MISRTPGSDPRLGQTPQESLALDQLEPVVGRPAVSGNTALITVALLSAGGLFLALNSHRNHTQPASLVSPASEVAAVAPASQTPPPPLKLEPAPASPAPPAAPLPPPLPSPNFAPIAVTGAVATPATAEGVQRQRAPTMVVDLGLANGDPARIQASTAAPGAVQGAGSPAAAAAGLTGSSPAVAAGGLINAANVSSGSQTGGDDQFAQRVEDERPARSRAVTMSNLDTLVPQGAIIPATLETAIDSDLPGYTRAVVSRDVRSFDGRNVLIPRGSRLIGQYKSAVSLGASRAFVIWTRIIRDDGVSIQIGSPGTDPLGRGGLSGEVNRHFFARFGGSILLSILNAGVAAVSRNPTTTISIGSPGAAVGATNGIQADSIPPTIKVAQGSAINIFVARDLDFSGVAAVK